MRIVIVGDLQYNKGEKLCGIANDIDSLNPDRVIFLGDYGYWDGFGSYEVFSEINAAFKGNIVPLLGNHDVQYEAGERKVKSGTVAAGYERAFGYPPKNQILEFDDFRVFCIHIDCRPKDSFWFEYECFVSDENFEWIKTELKKYPEKPAIMITHAPPAVSGLLNVPELHVRASNAYLDQDHGYQRWTELTRDFRQIIMWFNGHYHMGHRHENSMITDDGLAYFVTGSPTSQSRDGQRHTRVIDCENGIITVCTFDHDTKKLLGDYTCIAKIRGKADTKAKTGVFSAGCGRVVPDGLKYGKNGRAYAMTDNDFLWEIDLESRIAAGTLHYSDNYSLDSFAVDEEYVWRICGDKLFGHRYDDKNRFMREKDYDRCNYITSKSPVMDLGRSFMYKGRVACKINDNLILTSYNDEEGRLLFEISEEI